MPNPTTDSGPGFFLHVDGRFLCCLGCGDRKQIEDRPGARAEAEETHVCALACGCWSAMCTRRQAAIVATSDRVRHRQRLRALERAKRHVAARSAQAELRRMGRDPGPLLGAAERLRRAITDEATTGYGQVWR